MVTVDTAVVDVLRPMGETVVETKCWKMVNHCPRFWVVVVEVVVIVIVAVVEVVEVVIVSVEVVEFIILVVTVVSVTGPVMIQLHASDNKELGNGRRTTILVENGV